MSENSYTPDKERYCSGMRYRRCGSSGIMLPEVSLGLWHNFGEYSDLDNCRKIVCYALDNGINHFDLANNYGPPPGSSETNFGRIMRDILASYRHEMFISTKAGHRMWDGPYGDNCSRKNLFNSIDQSLKRMNLDYVDVFYSHRYDGVTPIEETMEALIDIVRSGKAIYIGISKYPPEIAENAYRYLNERNAKCLVYQGRYNILDRKAEQDGTIELAERNKVGFTAFSPLAQGLLTDRYLNGIPDNSRMALDNFLKRDRLTSGMINTLNSLNKIASERGQTLAEMALAWILNDNRVSSVIIGASSVEQLRKNIKSLNNISFSEKELHLIDSASNLQ